MPGEWPEWVEEIKTRYLADEASVFLLHGAVEGATWEVEGHALDCGAVLKAMLCQTREIVASVHPVRGMEFSSVTDRAAFARLIEARAILDGRRSRNPGRTTEDRLAQVYLALTTPGPAQGYVIHGVDQLAPAARKNLPPLPDGAPHLAAWATHRAIRASNNIVLLLAPGLSSVRADLALAAAHVHVPSPPRAPAAADPYAGLLSRRAASAQPPGDDGATSPTSASPDASPPEVPTPAAPTDEAPDLTAPNVDSAAPSSEALQHRLQVALRAALIRHASGVWPDKLPVREAVAATLLDVAPERFGALEFVVEGEALQVRGAGAEAFEAWWRGDVAVDAAAGMLLAGVVVPEGGLRADALPELSASALRALARRLTRLLTSPADRA